MLLKINSNNTTLKVFPSLRLGYALTTLNLFFFFIIMVNAYSMEGMFIICLLFCCSLAYIRKVPRLKQIFLSERRGTWGAFYKGAVIGVRLHWLVSLCCLAFGINLLSPVAIF